MYFPPKALKFTGAKTVIATNRHVFASLYAGWDVLVVMEDVVRVVPGLHVHQPVVDGVAVRLADPVGIFVAA